MTTLLEDLRLALRQICRAIGLSGTALTVIPLVVLGVALNLAALSAMAYMRGVRHLDHGHTALQSAVRTELKVMRTVLGSTLKKIGNGQRKWCLTQQWVTDRQTEGKGYHIEVGFVWAAPSSGEGCDVEIVGSHRWKTAVTFVQC
jgi:hypothetical protein